MLNSSQYVCFLKELVGKEVLICRVKQREREHSILNSRIDILFKYTSNVLQNRSQARSQVSTNVER